MDPFVEQMVAMLPAEDRVPVRDAMNLFKRYSNTDRDPAVHLSVDPTNQPAERWYVSFSTSHTSARGRGATLPMALQALVQEARGLYDRAMQQAAESVAEAERRVIDQRDRLAKLKGGAT